MVEPETNDEFMSWAASLGLTFQQRHVPSSLGYAPDRSVVHSWAIPGRSKECLEFVNWVVAGLGPWSSCVLWPFAGIWPTTAWLPRVGGDDTTWPLFLRGAGIPDEWEGSVRMERGQANAVNAVAFTFAAFGSSSQDDLFVIPDHGRQFLHVDPWNCHPGTELLLPAIHVHSSTNASAEQFKGHMSRVFDAPPLS